MPGVLYIVATPIGNLADISQRAIEVLRSVDLVAAEDTRHSRQLLNHLGIKAELRSYHEHNEQSRSADLLKGLEDGLDIALISDAGTPLISDPGYTLVTKARAAGHTVSPIPGACSIVAALCAAGLPTDQFTFVGFLPTRDKERLQRLESVQSMPGTIVLLESTHRIRRLLQQIEAVMAERQIIVAKELTKAHEHFFAGSARQIASEMDADERLQKGEFVVLIDNQHEQPQAAGDQELNHLLTCLLRELPVKKAASVAAEITGVRKNDLYQRALEIKAE